ncbi:MAG: TPM domain-containing protein [Candidatus Zixiibacteriota bacterium]
MRKPIYFLLGLMILLAGCGGDTRYDSNISVPKGDPPFPPLGISWVIDKAKILSDSVMVKGDVICQKLKEDGIAEVVIVIINSVKHPEDWATHYGRWLGLGRKGLSVEGGNNGLVWLIRPDAENKMTISVGRGLPRFTTSDYGPIIERVVEYLNFNNFDRGVTELIMETDQVLRAIYGSKR